MAQTKWFVFAVMVLTLVVTGCDSATSTPETIKVEVTREVQVVETNEVTKEVTRLVEQTVEVTRVVQVVVTATPTPTPVNSPTPTLTPSITPTPSNTPTSTPTPNIDATATVEAMGELIEPKDDGFYLVGIDIAPGLWRSQGDGEDCYWQRLDSDQETLDNHYGQAGGTVRIRPTDFEVHFKRCGTWIYLGD